MLYKANTEGSEGKIVSPKAKALSTEKVSEDSKSTELKELKHIKSLATIIKGATVGNVKSKMGNWAPSPRKKEVSSNSPQKPLQGSPRQTKGPGTSVTGPFRPGQKPIKCYCHDGWGHGWQECLIPENLNWKELIQATVPSPTTDPGSNPTPTPNLSR